MKRAVILHGTEGTPESNWFPWLKTELEKRGYEVWVPQLPDAEEPDAAKWTKFLLESNWDFSDNLLIGHSAGAVEILKLLPHMANGIKVKTAVLVASFTEDLAQEPNWLMLKNLFNEPFDFDADKSAADKFLFVHASDDPYCDPKQAIYLAEQVSGEYIELSSGQHFSQSLNPAFSAFPQLLELLEVRNVL